MMITLSTKLAMDLMVLSFSTVVGTGGDGDPRIVTFPVGAVVWLYCVRMHNCYQDDMYQPTTRIIPCPFNVILHAISHSDIDFIEINRPFFSHVGMDPLTSTVGS